MALNHFIVHLTRTTDLTILESENMSERARGFAAHRLGTNTVNGDSIWFVSEKVTNSFENFFSLSNLSELLTSEASTSPDQFRRDLFPYLSHDDLVEQLEKHADDIFAVLKRQTQSGDKRVIHTDVARLLE